MQKTKIETSITTNILTYFFRGILVLAPLGLTFYIVYKTVSVVDNFANDIFEWAFGVRLPFLGFLITLVLVYFIGLIASTLLMQWVLRLFEIMFNQTRFTRWIYHSLKDLFGAFVNDKKKFDQPVMICLNAETGLHKLGFITQEDKHYLENLSLIGVYVPHSYNFSGDLYFVPRHRVQYIAELNSAEAMKLIVSGGISKEEENNNNHG